jgi:hypothetical protein
MGKNRLTSLLTISYLGLRSGLPMNTEWEVVYHCAVLEVDRQLIPERIVAARQAIRERLRALTGDPDHHAERKQLEDALRALAVLKAEAKNGSN